MSSAAQREALTNPLTGAGHAIEYWAGRCGRHSLCPLGALKSWKDGESDDRVSQRRAGRKSAVTYTREGAGGARDRALEWEPYVACYCRCAAFLGRGQALVGL